MACTFRMTYEEAARQPVSVRAQECCAHFGYPYQAIVEIGRAHV